jgi:hypothetical protein
MYYARTKGQNFGDADNKIDATVSGSWERFSIVEDDDRIVDFQAVLWNGTSGSFLTLRDAYSFVIYYAINVSPMLMPDVLPSFMTVRLPIQYLTNESSSSIHIFGKYV